MAKTTILYNNSQLSFAYGVDTTVRSAGFIDSHTDPPNHIGVRVYPNSNDGIGFGTLLEISGVGRITVSGVGSDDIGQYFTYSPLILPSGNALVRTPWNRFDPFLVTRSRNSVIFTFEVPVEHDLYFRTQKTIDSGVIHVQIDDEDIGIISIASATSSVESVLLRSRLSAGSHTVTVTAEFPPFAVFVYFHSFEILEHNVETGGEYLYLGPSATIDDSSINFIGQWGTTGVYAYTTDISAKAFFYPQLSTGGQIQIRTQRTTDSGIVAIYVNGVYRQTIDLYSNPAEPLYTITLLDVANGDPEGLYEIEIRQTGTKNVAANGTFLYFHSAVVKYIRTDDEALIPAANYLLEVANLRTDGAILDAWDSTIINFDATALYACMGLLAAYTKLQDPVYLEPVRKFLLWLAQAQDTDGSWSIGYQVDPNSPLGYISTTGPYLHQGISDIKWVDAVQCLPSFVLWWYWKLSQDNATKDALAGSFRKAIDGFIAHNYDPETGFFFSSWQNKTSPTIFIYHDGVRRYSASGQLLEQRNDADTFFEYSGSWSSYSPQNAIGGDEHFTLNSDDYVQFSLQLNVGDQLYWVTQRAWDSGIAELLIAHDGVQYTQLLLIDTYASTSTLQCEFHLYTASANGQYWFRIRHSGTINSAGNNAPGWQKLTSRFSAGQSDVLLGLLSMWQLTRKPKYAVLSRRILERYPRDYWSESDTRWLISLDGPTPATRNAFWYPMSHGYTAFAQIHSRLFQPLGLFARGLQSLEPYQDSQGGFLPPGYLEPEYIFSAFYLIGENQLDFETGQSASVRAREHLKSGQYLLNLNGKQVGGIAFSKRFQYLYTNISGFACMALAEVKSPLGEQINTGKTKLLVRQ